MALFEEGEEAGAGPEQEEGRDPGQAGGGGDQERIKRGGRLSEADLCWCRTRHVRGREAGLRMGREVTMRTVLVPPPSMACPGELIEAAVTRKREHLDQAAMLDPHASSELSLDEIVWLCDDLIEAHGDWLPEYY